MLISRAKVYKSFATVMSFQKTLTLCVGFDFGLAARIFSVTWFVAIFLVV